MTQLPVTGKSSRPDQQVRRGEIFASLHRPGDPLLLPNAWDAASAVMIARAGARAIATTSAGVAWSLGARDAADLGAHRAATVIGRITAAVNVPVSADIEAGYGPDADAVAATVTAVIRAGAVGVNLEDRSGGDGVPLFEPAEQARRLAAARTAADRLAMPLWINARTDVFLVGAGTEAERVEAVLERAATYAAAGADSLFVPGLTDLATIAKLAAGPLPVGVMVWAGAPTVAQLSSAGVVRISLGSAIAQAAYAVAARATAELLSDGTYNTSADGIPYDEMNDALAPGSSPADV